MQSQVQLHKNSSYIRYSERTVFGEKSVDAMLHNFYSLWTKRFYGKNNDGSLRLLVLDVFNNVQGVRCAIGNEHEVHTALFPDCRQNIVYFYG